MDFKAWYDRQRGLHNQNGKTLDIYLHSIRCGDINR